MTQSSLLELARNGNPQAIASLMNQVLEPKGVVAKTQLEGSCLHIVFLSEHLLSQSAIASFVKNGLNALSPKTFQTIKLYAQKIGQDSPLWVDSFSLEQAISASPAKPASAASPMMTVAASSPAIATPVASTPSTTGSKAKRSAPPWSTSSRPQQPQKTSQIKQKPQQPQKTSQIKQKPPMIVQFIRHTTYRIRNLDIPNQLRRYPVAIAVSVSAFLIGGTAALIFYNQAKTSSDVVDAAQGEVALPLSSQSLVSSTPSPAANTPEAQVEGYLTQMNKAQAAFHQAHSRFATTLEELERSASIMSHSTHYTYRLVLRDDTQSVLTATPKVEGLKSYSGTVLFAAADQANAVTTIICKTNQPSAFPPILAQAAVAPILCPTDSTQLLN